MSDPLKYISGALMECNVSINFLLAIRQNYARTALAFCLIEIRDESGDCWSFAKIAALLAWILDVGGRKENF